VPESRHGSRRDVKPAALVDRNPARGQGAWGLHPPARRDAASSEPEPAGSAPPHARSHPETSSKNQQGQSVPGTESWGRMEMPDHPDPRTQRSLTSSPIFMVMEKKFENPTEISLNYSETRMQSKRNKKTRIRDFSVSSP